MIDTVRANHFVMLNQKPMPALGERWEINEKVWWYFLESFSPALGWSETKRSDGSDGWADASFYSPEFHDGDVTTKYTKQGERYFCEFAEYPGGADAMLDEMEEHSRRVFGR